MISSDVPALDELLAPELVFTNHLGLLFGKKYPAPMKVQWLKEASASLGFGAFPPNAIFGYWQVIPVPWQKADEIGLSPNVNVIYSGRSGTTELNQSLPQIRTQLESAYPGLGNYSDTAFLDGEAQVARLKYTATINGHLLKFMQILTINRSKEIVVTYTDAADRFDGNQDISSIDASMDIY